MAFRVDTIILVGLGIALIVFAQRIVDKMLKSVKPERLVRPKARSLLYVWPLRGMGVLCIVSILLLTPGGRVRRALANEENRIILLEQGRITKGKVRKAQYRHLTPKGWELLYDFAARDPGSGEEKTYVGGAHGPKAYYGNLTAGDAVDIIYYPPDPQINCEIRYVLNNPKFRRTFERAGKLGLLDRFRSEYEVKDYSFAEWYEQQHEK